MRCVILIVTPSVLGCFFCNTCTFPLLLSRGLYLTSIFYRDDSVLVTPEDQIPIVEVEDSYSSSLMQDFLWFTKVDRQIYRERGREKKKIDRYITTNFNLDN